MGVSASLHSEPGGFDPSGVSSLVSDLPPAGYHQSPIKSGRKDNDFPVFDHRLRRSAPDRLVLGFGKGFSVPPRGETDYLEAPFPHQFSLGENLRTFKRPNSQVIHPGEQLAFQGNPKKDRQRPASDSSSSMFTELRLSLPGDHKHR